MRNSRRKGNEHVARNGPMILLSNGGTNAHRSRAPSDTMVIGTVDGIVVLERSTQGWKIKHRALGGCSVSAVTASEDGILYGRDPRFWRRPQRRRWHDLDLDSRRPRPYGLVVGARRQACGPRRGLRRRAAGASLYQREPRQDLARTAGPAQRAERQQMVLSPAVAHRARQVYRVR